MTIFSTLPKRVNIWNRNKKKKLEGIGNCCSAIDVAIRTIVVLLGHNNNTIGHLPSLVTISTTTEGGKASKPREGRKEGRKEQGGRYYYRHRFDPIWWWLENGLDAISSSISPPLLPKGQATRYLSLASSIHPRDRPWNSLRKKKNSRTRFLCPWLWTCVDVDHRVRVYIYVRMCVFPRVRQTFADPVSMIKLAINRRKGEVRG